MQISDFQTISLLFSEQNQYKIPRYQRRYVWNMINWETLWQDIIQLMANSDDTHFAGTIMMYQEKEMVTEIIDGQQRLTTFQIILCVIRDLWESSKYENDVSDEIKREIEGYYRTYTQMGNIRNNTTANTTDEYRIIPSSLDVNAFKYVVSKALWKEKIKDSTDVLQAFDTLFKNGLNENGRQLEQDLIVKAYGYFGKEIVKHLEKGKLSELVVLFDVFTTRSQVIKVTIQSEDKYDPERIFQTINDTGRMLTSFDYLRNYLFLRTRNRLGAQPSDKLYEENWDRFEMWDDLKRKQFFQAYLKAKLGPEYFKYIDRKPFDCYRKNIKILEGSGSKYFIPILELSRYAVSYDELNITDEKDEDTQNLGNRMQFYDDLKLPRLDWFLLFMKHASESSDTILLGECVLEKHDADMIALLELYQKKRKENNPELSWTDMKNLCNMLESYIVRRWLCDGEYVNSYEKINSFFSKFPFGSEDINVPNFIKHLSDSWSCPEKVKEMLKEWALNAIEPDLVRYILYRIELWNRKCFPPPLDFESMPNLEQIVELNVLLTPPIVYTTDTVISAANSIGNIQSPTFSPDRVSTIDNIRDRTDKLLDCFDKIWEPAAEDYL